MVFKIMKQKSDYQKQKLPKLTLGRTNFYAYSEDLQEKYMKRNPKIQKHKKLY